MSIFNCVFCSLAYNNIDKKPKILPCGHIFCEKCISSFVNKALNGIICICPLDNKIHKFLNSFQIPICEQIFENIPLSNLSEKEKEISNYINKLENKINIIQKQINSYKKTEKNIIDYFNEQINKINQFYDSFNCEIQKKRNLLLEELTNLFKEQNLKIERNRKLIFNYTSKLDEIIKNYEKISETKNYENFLLERKKTEKDLNTIISFINENIINESQIQYYPLFIEPKELLIPNNLLGELKIINNNNNYENEEEINSNDSQSDFGNVTNIFNQNLLNEINKLQTPIKCDKKKSYFLFSENSFIHKKIDHYKFFPSENISINATEKKVSFKKMIITPRNEKENLKKKSCKKENSNNKNIRNKNEKSKNNNFRLNKDKNLKFDKIQTIEKSKDDISDISKYKNKKEIKNVFLNKNNKNTFNNENKNRNLTKVFSPKSFKSFNVEVVNEIIS